MHARSGVGMGGLAPLSYTTLTDYCALTGTVLSPMEVVALVHLDAVLLTPEPKTPEKPVVAE